MTEPRYLLTFKNLRIWLLCLLLILASIISYHQLQFTRSWHKPLNIIVYPINGDRTPQTQAYIDSLHSKNFATIDTFMAREGQRYQLVNNTPTKTILGPPVTVHPPLPPRDTAPWNVLLWGLKMRWWAYKYTPDDLSNLRRVRVFVVYHDPKRQTSIPHSLGMQKGLLGLVHAFADEGHTQQNNIIIAHEMLHTVGASDKYQLSGLPMFPHGFANPYKNPLYPQKRAEIMAGRRAISSFNASMPHSLFGVVIGEQTAREINWIP